MLQKRIIPFLLLSGNYFVKTIRFKDPHYIGEPIYAIKIFNDYEVDELIIVDIEASRPVGPASPTHKKAINLDLISKISDESCMPITYGGGITNVAELKALFNAGIEKACINTNAIENPEFISLASQEFGKQSIVVSIDTKVQTDGSYDVATRCGTRSAGINPITCAKKMEKAGAGEILINSIDRDGTMLGYDIPLIKSVVSAVNIPVIALGGAGQYSDFSRALNSAGASAVAAGSMFVYFGRKKAVLINYPGREEIEDIMKNVPVNNCEQNI